ncbi:ABC transporter ATP-binding protein [Mesorhizobium koreense]|uniref:ABC transporter ATP-binding protein n=1 Tax=Mesorhizobium koreense TaxID=3074855 RepID=UPI00287B8BE1|nr:ABC transporter ATP-binding protein [Mesorhizobium sp. WR6]
MSVGALSQSRPAHKGADTPLVEIEGLGRTFDLSKRWLNRVLEGSGKVMLTAVDGVDMSIRRGETYALVGESGSGKSTIAKMVVGLLPPSAGSVRIDGVDIWKELGGAQQRQIRRRIQMIFQDPFASLNPRWRVGSIIEEPIKAFGLIGEKRGRENRVGELLSLVGLDPRDAGKFPHEFSGGQRQRIAIARALSSNPEFIVCDEPTSALDVSVQAQVLNLLRDLQERLGLTYLFISHNLAVVRHVANRVGVLYLGRLVEEAPARALFSDPQHPYTKMLLDSVPDIDMTGKERTPIAGEIPNPVNPPPGCHFHPRCPFRFEPCDKVRPPLKEYGQSRAACHALEERRIAS